MIVDWEFVVSKMSFALLL